MVNKFSPNFYHQYFAFPGERLAYYRNVRTGLRSTLTALGELYEKKTGEDLSLDKGVGTVRERFLVDGNSAPDCLRFTFVRNPFRRIESIFSYGIGRGRFFPEESRNYAKFGFSQATTFEEFVEAMMTIPPNYADDFICPQVYRFFDQGVKRVHYIGKLEDISDEWVVLMKVNGTEHKLPYRGKSEKKSPLLWTSQMRDEVYEYYRDDFEVFSYLKNSIEVADGKASNKVHARSSRWSWSKEERASVKKWIESHNETIRKFSENNEVNDVSIVGLLSQLKSISELPNLGENIVSGLEESKDWQTSLRVTAAGKNLTANFGSNAFFPVSEGEIIHVSALLKIDDQLDGTIRIGLHVIDGNKTSVQWPSLFIKAKDLKPNHWNLVEGALVIAKPSSAQARPWLCLVEDANKGGVEVSEISYQREFPSPKQTNIPDDLIAPIEALSLRLAADPIMKNVGGDYNCAICGHLLTKKDRKNEGCENCGARARTRGLPEVVERHVMPIISKLPTTHSDTHPFLGFAMSGAEQRVIRANFENVKSASLYGENYSKENHEVGVDVRKMDHYKDNSFSGIMGVLLFDYFPETEAGLSECFRTLTPGGVFFTHVAPGRLIEDEAETRTTAYIESRKGYFEYVPNDNPLPSVKFGRMWFMQQMQKVGFETKHVKLGDPATGLISDWFIGSKPKKKS